MPKLCIYNIDTGTKFESGDLAGKPICPVSIAIAFYKYPVGLSRYCSLCPYRLNAIKSNKTNS